MLLVLDSLISMSGRLSIKKQTGYPHQELVHWGMRDLLEIGNGNCTTSIECCLDKGYWVTCELALQDTTQLDWFLVVM